MTAPSPEPRRDAAARRLRAERRRAAAQIEERRAQARAVAEQAATEGRDDEHDPDGATVAFEQSLAAGLLAQAVAYLAEVDAALGRLADGSYGRCDQCGRHISRERLAALPAARSCTLCTVRPRVGDSARR